MQAMPKWPFIKAAAGVNKGSVQQKRRNAPAAAG
jgi:hypothetical protein